MNTKYQARPSNIKTETEIFFATAEQAIDYAREVVATTSAEYCTLEKLFWSTRDAQWKVSSDRQGLPLAITKKGAYDADQEYSFYGQPETW